MKSWMPDCERGKKQVRTTHPSRGCAGAGAAAWTEPTATRPGCMRSAVTVVRVLLPAVVVGGVTFLLCGVLVGFEFAARDWYVSVVAAIVGGLLLWLVEAIEDELTHRHDS